MKAFIRKYHYQWAKYPAGSIVTTATTGVDVVGTLFSPTIHCMECVRSLWPLEQNFVVLIIGACRCVSHIYEQANRHMNTLLTPPPKEKKRKGKNCSNTSTVVIQKCNTNQNVPDGCECNRC